MNDNLAVWQNSPEYLLPPAVVSLILQWDDNRHLVPPAAWEETTLERPADGVGAAVGKADGDYFYDL